MDSYIGFLHVTSTTCCSAHQQITQPELKRDCLSSRRSLAADQNKAANTHTKSDTDSCATMLKRVFKGLSYTKTEGKCDQCFSLYQGTLSAPKIPEEP